MDGAVKPTETARAWLAAALGVETSFPWQNALLARLIRNSPPCAVDIPTGLGKTAVMAIWLVARAAGAALPRRLVYVVDRRAVVDQATDVALGLRDFVERTPGFKTALGIAASAHLPISTLRGQFADNREWLADPASPAIVLGTVDMIGSRLLFEGYGTSRRMRPYHAGLLGADALIVLDEAHLTPSFEALVEAIAAGGALGGHDEVAAHVPPLRLMSLSATGRSASDTFTLTEDDKNHDVVRRRLDARKDLVLRDPIDPTSLVEVLAHEAWKLSDCGTRAIRCIIYCDRRDDAQAVHEELRRLAVGDPKTGVLAVKIDTELFVGGRRVFERAAAAEWLKERGFVAGYRATPSRPTFVVSTSAGEVGVDLDADHMISDLVPWERMIQRLGRVNRRGEGVATIVVVPTGPDKKTRDALEKERKSGRPGAHHDEAPVDEEGPLPEEDDEKTETKKRLNAQELALVRRHWRLDASHELLRKLPSRGAAADASPGALAALKKSASESRALSELIARASTPAPLRPALTRPLADAWSMTSLHEHTGRPEVQPWVRGWVDDEAQTTIVWRRQLPVHEKGTAVTPIELARFFEAAPAHLLERLETETRSAMAWLESRLGAISKRGSIGASKDDSDLPGPQESDAVPAPESSGRTLSRTDIVAFVLAPRGEISTIRADSFERGKRTKEIGDRLAGATLFVDVRVGGLTAGLLDVIQDGASDVGDAPGVLPFRVHRAARAVNEPTPAVPGWREELRLGLDHNAESVPTRWLVVETDRRNQPTTEEGRSTSRAQLLVEHQEWAERQAHDIGLRLGLPQAYVDMLALAARLHDEGKRARRWQRAFNAPTMEPWGKTTSRPSIQLLDGYRHEIGSLPFAERDSQVARLDDELRDLCLHLIAAHHGFARPFLPTDGCDDAPPSVLVVRAREVALRFMRLQARWGPWGLAWWEALLRAADQRASRENDKQGNDHG